MKQISQLNIFILMLCVCTTGALSLTWIFTLIYYDGIIALSPSHIISVNRYKEGWLEIFIFSILFILGLRSLKNIQENNK